jgi:Domain of unknown function (DUF4381)
MSLSFGVLEFGFLAQAASSPLPEIKDIAPPVDVFPYPPWMIALAGGAALLLVVAATWFFARWQKNRPAPAPPTPREVALTKLTEARAQIERLQPYDFSILVSDILRSYVAAQYHLHAKEQTSPEFLTSISNSPHFSESEKSLLALFLDKCDLIKFARIDATVADSAMLLDEAIRFVKGGGA